MGAHLNADGEFQSDKYPATPPGKVPLSVRDPTAQDLLWEYARRRRAVDPEFSDDLEAALSAVGYAPPAGEMLVRLKVSLGSASTISIVPPLPARKEWSAERSGGVSESSEYVEGWNDALDAVDAAAAPRRG